MYNSGGDNNHQMNGSGGGAGNSATVASPTTGVGGSQGVSPSVYANGNTSVQSGAYNAENASNLGTRETGIIEKLLVCC